MSGVDFLTSAVIFIADGGSRNFQHVQRLSMNCTQENVNLTANSIAKIAQGGFINRHLYHSSHRTRKDYEAVIIGILYKDGLYEDGSVIWCYQSLFEPLYVETSGEKDSLCAHQMISHVPMFEKFKPRMFPSVKEMCAALSSTSLPLLKTHWMVDDKLSHGLNIRDFTEVIFKHLYSLYPRVIEPDEAAYTVAVIQVHSISWISLPQDFLLFLR